MFSLAYIVTHPIQYQAPLLRLIAASQEISLKVFFLSDFSLHAHHEAAFGQTFKWDVNLTDGYDWEVLPRWGIGSSTPMRPWWPVRGLKERLKAGRFDAVWVHGWGHIGLRQAIRAGHEMGLPVLLRGESAPAPEPRRDLRRRLRNVFCRQIFKQIRGFLCIGTRNREFYRQFDVPTEKLFLMPYAVDNDWFQARCTEAAIRRVTFRRELGLEPDRRIFLFAAKFIPAKAPTDLLTAFRQVWREAQGAKPYLLFVGDGPLRADLEKQAGALGGKDVRFMGFRNQTEMPAFYDLCDVFVLPSHHEPWGLVVNEVMNAGKPVIASDQVGATPDLIANDMNDFTYHSGNTAALGARLKQVLASPP